MTRKVTAINWNRAPEFERTIWNKLTEQFWLPEKVSLSGDIGSWQTLSHAERTATARIFAGLTHLDTIQGTVGAISLIQDASNPFEEAILTNMAFMESVHAKSYSSIFSTLYSTREIDEVFAWADSNKHLAYKADTVLKYYEGDDPLKKKVASTMLEGFLFYSGFYMPLFWTTRGKLNATGDLVKLIIKDEGVHSYMIGQWYQKALALESEARKEEMQTFTYDLLIDLYENEEEYTESIYDGLDMTADVKKFLKYNANKALMNLGYDPLYPKAQTEVSAAVLNALGVSGENHDFFSGSGSTYVIGKAEDTEDEDWDF